MPPTQFGRQKEKSVAFVIKYVGSDVDEIREHEERERKNPQPYTM